MTTIQIKEVREQQDTFEQCSDLDEDCDDIESKVDCWLYAPGCGICPYLTGKK